MDQQSASKRRPIPLLQALLNMDLVKRQEFLTSPKEQGMLGFDNPGSFGAAIRVPGADYLPAALDQGEVIVLVVTGPDQLQVYLDFRQLLGDPIRTEQAGLFDATLRDLLGKPEIFREHPRGPNEPVFYSRHIWPKSRLDEARRNWS